jgi:hypothetical protein
MEDDLLKGKRTVFNGRVSKYWLAGWSPETQSKANRGRIGLAV